MQTEHASVWAAAPVLAQSGLFARWKGRLLAPAYARLIAIKLVDLHGDRAAEHIGDAIGIVPPGADERTVLARVGREIEALIGQR